MRAQALAGRPGWRRRQAIRTGIKRYKKSALSLPRSTAGFNGSTVSMAISGEPGGLEAIQQELGVERDREFASLVFGFDGLVGLADVLGGGGQLQAGGVHGQPDRAGVSVLATDEADPVHRVGQRVAFDGQLVRIPARHQLLVVRELSFDETCRELGAVEAERHVAFPEEHLDIAFAGEEPLKLPEALRPHEHGSSLGQQAHTREVTDGETVRVGGDEANPVGRRGDEDPGEDRAGVVA